MAKTVELVSDVNASNAVKVVDVANDLLDKIQKIVASDINNELKPKDIKDLLASLKSISDIKGEKAPLDIEEQKARIKNLERQAGSDSDADDNGHGVAIMPEIVPVVPFSEENADE